MSAIEALLTQPAANAIGRALLQFVWQGVLIGGITAVVLTALRRSAADIRYVVATIGLSLMLTVPVVTAVQSWRAIARTDAAPQATRLSVVPPSPRAASSGIPAPPAEPGILAEAFRSEARSGPVTPWTRMLVLVWLCGVAVLTLRLMSGWLWVQRMKSHGTAPAAAALQDVAERLRRRLHIGRRVRFLESTLVEVPTVIGWLKPVVLMPACALGALAPQQLEAIIAHELAHIRRHDYLVNLLQTLVETLLFYHPAVWWLSRRIRIEREHCCDDLAVSLCGDPITYAGALAELEERRSGTRLALAASDGSLLQRIRRLLGAPTHAGRGPGWLAGTVSVLLIAGIAAGAVTSDDSAPVHPRATAAAPASHSLQEAASESARATLKRQPVPDGQSQREEAASEAQSRAREMVQDAERMDPVIAASARAVEESAHAMAVAAAAAQLPAAVAELESGAAMAHAGGVLANAVASVAGALPRLSITSANQSGNFTWSNGTEKLHVNYRGAIEFTDDDADVRRISPGGWLKIREGGRSGSRTVEFRANASGALARRYWAGHSEKPFEPEGREWLAKALPRFIRQTGLGAEGRVARILASNGVDGVLAEIALIEGSWARRVYYTELLKHDSLDERSIEQILSRVGDDLASDFELATLLIGSADRLLVSEATRTAYFDATRTIGSDFELRRVHSAALRQGPVSPEVLAALLDASLTIQSDFEAASLLIQIAKLQPLDSRSVQLFVKALDGVQSDFEQRRALDTLVSTGNLSVDDLPAVLESAASIGSDFEQASFLLTVLKHYSIEGAPTAPFFRAVDTAASAFERGRVLQALAKRSDASPDTIVAILRATQAMRSGFESSRVLLAVAENHSLTGEARDLYIEVAGKLGDYEQGRALTALIRGERGR